MNKATSSDNNPRRDEIDPTPSGIARDVAEEIRLGGMIADRLDAAAAARGTPPACPVWCELEPGHPYEGDYSDTHDHRLHQRTLIPRVATVYQGELRAMVDGEVSFRRPGLGLDGTGLGDSDLTSSETATLAGRLFRCAGVVEAIEHGEWEPRTYLV